jgi:hypothetical protein
MAPGARCGPPGGFESLSSAENGPGVLGPEGISAGGGDVKMIMSESIPGVRASDNLSAHQLGMLIGLDPADGGTSRLSDVGSQQYDWTGDHQTLVSHDFPDSNPYAVLITGSGSGERTFVADAGANNTPNDTNPDGSCFDSTPTCIAKGSDGMLYVATLDLLPNSVLSGQNRQGPPGDLVKIVASEVARRTTDDLIPVGGGRLPLPGGIAQGPGDAMFVSLTRTAPLREPVRWRR